MTNDIPKDHTYRHDGYSDKEESAPGKENPDDETARRNSSSESAALYGTDEFGGRRYSTLRYEFPRYLFCGLVLNVRFPRG